MEEKLLMEFFLGKDIEGPNDPNYINALKLVVKKITKEFPTYESYIFKLEKYEKNSSPGEVCKKIVVIGIGEIE